VCGSQYHNFAQRGSGEYALNTVLQPGVKARIDMEPRLVPSTLNNAPLYVIYGEKGLDWMDTSFGVRVSGKYRDLGGGSACDFVTGAGHQVRLPPGVAGVAVVA
jgi:hypothetical protein